MATACGLRALPLHIYGRSCRLLRQAASFCELPSTFKPQLCSLCVQVGELGVVSFGGSGGAMPLHPLERPFTDADGVRVMSQVGNASKGQEKSPVIALQLCAAAAAASAVCQECSHLACGTVGNRSWQHMLPPCRLLPADAVRPGQHHQRPTHGGCDHQPGRAAGGGGCAGRVVRRRLLAAPAGAHHRRWTVGCAGVGWWGRH